eukprot:TRINITY_DN232_c0_g4_i2.p1 TRINITY_DN232_c0_g4~~TRINITY_DN232_c0_g4_i2.p1  ORF type:complete len:152 (+),score=1.73 TRINITY_DN232_c0_g4_i2:235-690(+)
MFLITVLLEQLPGGAIFQTLENLFQKHHKKILSQVKMGQDYQKGNYQSKQYCNFFYSFYINAFFIHNTLFVKIDVQNDHQKIQNFSNKCVYHYRKFRILRNTPEMQQNFKFISTKIFFVSDYFPQFTSSQASIHSLYKSIGSDMGVIGAEK